MTEDIIKISLHFWASLVKFKISTTKYNCLHFFYVSESGRAHRELNPIAIAEVVSGLAESSNKSHKVFASCVVTNLLHIKDST